MKPLILISTLLIIFCYTNAQVTRKNVVNLKTELYCTDYSNNGNYIAVGGGNKEIIIVDANNISEVTRLKGMKGFALSVAFSPDNNFIAAGGKDNNLTIWNISTKQVVKTLKAHKAQIMGIAFSPCGKYIASASHDKQVILWNIATGLPERYYLGHTKEVNSVSFSPDGSSLVSGSADGTIKIWDVKTASLKKSINAHNNWVCAVKYSNDGSVIASGGYDRIINLWDAINGEKINTFIVHRKWVQTLCFSPDCQYLLSGGHDNVVVLTDVRTGRVVFQSPKLDNFVLGVAFNPNGSSFSSVELYSGKLEIWDTNTLGIKKSEKPVAQASSISGMVPVVNILSPRSGAAVSGASVKVSANIKSISSLRTIELYLNNKLYSSKGRSELMLETNDSELTSFDEQVILADGDNIIQIKVKNIAGEGVSAPVKIERSLSDQKVLTWVNPAQNFSQTNLAKYQLKALINSAHSIQSVEVIVNGQKQITVSVPAAGGMFVQDIELKQGDNKIQLVVTTSDFTRPSDERVINHVLANKPVVKWLSPMADTITYVSANTIRGYVESQVPVDKVQIKLNGLVVYNKLKPGSSNYFIDQQLQLLPGPNTLQIIAVNSSGETVSGARVISFQQTTKTNISWFLPSTDTIVYKPNLTISACIQSVNPVSKVELYNNDGIMFTETNLKPSSVKGCDYLFSKPVYVAPGTNALKIVAMHQNGTTESEIRNINFVMPIPATISWVYPSGNTISVTEKTIEIKACIRSNSKINSYSVFVNNQVFATEQNPGLSTDGCYYVDQAIVLNSGINNVIVKTKNMAGESMSAPVDINFKRSDPYRYALIIGNEDYSSYQVDLASESNVDFAMRDAQAFKELCLKKLGIAHENIFYKENARFIEMRTYLKRISQFIENSGGKAEVFVFYAGHGFPDEKTKEPYLVPVDGNGTDLEITALKLSDFYSQLTAFPAKRVTVFIDACFSGGARNQGLVAARGVKITPKPEKESVKKNLIVFTASSGNESSLPYKDKQHGMFTYYLLEKINSSAGKLTYKELSDYLAEMVSQQSIRVNGKTQQPQTNVSVEVQNVWENWDFFE